MAFVFMYLLVGIALAATLRYIDGSLESPISYIVFWPFALFAELMDRW